MLHDVVVVVGRTRPRSVPLAVLTMKKRVARVSISMHACGFVPIVMGCRNSADIAAILKRSPTSQG